jgi:hypothetical protein
MFKTRNRRQLWVVVSLVVVLSLLATIASSGAFAGPPAQAEDVAPPQPAASGDAPTTRSENGIPDEPPSLSEEPAVVEINPEVAVSEDTPASPDAPVGIIWEVQGRLTDAAGKPINGNRTITMRLYDVSTGGVPLCEDPDTVAVVNGLFTFAFDFCTTGDISGTQLYLGMQVQGEAAEMTPRQPIRPVPYAASLVNNAVIGAFKSTATSEVAVSPLKAVQPAGSNITLTPHANGYIIVSAGTTGQQWAYVPVDVPSKLFGTPSKLLNFRVCYQSSNALTRIDETDVRYATDTGGYVDQIADLTDRNSTVWSCYTVTDATPITIGGAVMVRFVLNFNSTAHTINIGKITLTLTEN